VNDEEGHPAGDRVLCRVADTLKAEARGSDVVVRYGGDEFLVILPGGTASAARSLAERVRARLAGLVGVSAGIALYRPELQSPDELIREADRALYAAKPRQVLRGGAPN
jgi:diguanylate cyclase (GGDEF)-like protein